MQTAARILSRRIGGAAASGAASAVAAVGAPGVPAGGALVARHAVGGGCSSGSMPWLSYSSSWRGSLTNEGMDGGFATRGFAHASTPSYHGHSHGSDDADAEKITVTFIEKDGTETVVQAGVFCFLQQFRPRPPRRTERRRGFGGAFSRSG